MDVCRNGLHQFIDAAATAQQLNLFLRHCDEELDPCNRLFREEQLRRQGGVHFIHVKGHSGDEGNDHADDRVQWGKGEGPYCRFALDGSYEGDPDSCLSSRDEDLSAIDSGPGLLDVINCSDMGNIILDECGVIDLAKLSIVCKPAKEAVQLLRIVKP